MNSISTMNTHSPEVVALSKQLAQAVEIALNPDMPQDERRKAYDACEEIKEKSPHSVSCSIYLSLYATHKVRHFGLQLMTYCVKYKWSELNQSQKISIRNTIIRLLESGEGSFGLFIHLRDALSRVFVEMMKRDWPHQQANLLPELFQLAAKGWIQAEIVLLTMLRFVEDVFVLQAVEHAERRRDLNHHLMSQMEQVFVFLMNLIRQHNTLNIPSESVQVINLALKLFSELIEFASVYTIEAESTGLVSKLCNLLGDKHFQLDAVECLNRIASKKNKQDKKTVCKLLMSQMVLGSMGQAILMLQISPLNEKNYLCIKKISELLVSLCNLLCSLVDNKNGLPYEYMKQEAFAAYLQILLKLCTHSSLVVSHSANICWATLFKHSVLNKEANLLACVAEWVSAVTPKLVRIPYNRHFVAPLFEDCHRYLEFDFDSEEAFNNFFYKFRKDLSETFRHLTAIAPQVVFSNVMQWFSSLTEKSSQLPSTLCSPYSDVYLEWEAISMIFEGIITSLPKCYTVPLEQGLRLLDMCFSLKPADPKIRSFVQSCITPLVYFVHIAPDEVASRYVMQLLERLFQDMVYEEPEETPCNQSRSVIDMRRRAICMLLKLSRRYPTMFLPYWDHISGVFNDLKNHPDKLSKLEVALLLEAVIQINNNWSNFERQSLFVKQVFAEVKEYWMNLSSDILTDPQTFSSFIGLDVQPSEFYSSYENRTQLNYCVDLIGAVIKSSTWPKSKEAALEGGFAMMTIGPNIEQATGCMAKLRLNMDEEMVFSNPAAAHILPALSGIFLIIKVMHCLWTDEEKMKLPFGYEKVHELSEKDLKQLFGGHIPMKETDVYNTYAYGSTNAMKMHSFLSSLYEVCLVVLAKSCCNLGYDFYELPNFAPSFGSSVFCNLNSVSDYQLRYLMKIFLIPFICNCPRDKYNAVLVPILKYFSCYMCERLSASWKYLKECHENGLYEEVESKLEPYFNDRLSTEYMNVVRIMLFKNNNVEDRTNGIADSKNNSSYNVKASTKACDALSVLGIELLICEDSRHSIVSFILKSISRIDSSYSLKATAMVPVIVKQLICDRNMTAAMSMQILENLLKGLQVYGQQDANRNVLIQAAVQCYHVLRPSQPQLFQILTMIPAVNLYDLKKFDERIQFAADKNTRDMFCKLVINLIGSEIGQFLKRRETLDLPKIEIPGVESENILNTSVNRYDVGIANFFS